MLKAGRKSRGVEVSALPIGVATIRGTAETCVALSFAFGAEQIEQACREALALLG